MSDEEAAPAFRWLSAPPRFSELSEARQQALSRGQAYIDPDSRIGADVNIGTGNWIGPNVVFQGSVTIGNRNAFLAGVCIGAPSRQRIQSQAERIPSNNPSIAIGDSNTFYEYGSVHLPMADRTVIGNSNSIGARTHISHDCWVDDHIVIAANCSFGGYVRILERANIGLGVDVHPRRVIGAFAICGAGAVIVRHIAPGAKVAGVPARYLGPNQLGLERAGFSANQISNWSRWLSGAPVGQDERTSQSIAEFCEAVAATRGRVAHIPQTAALQG